MQKPSDGCTKIGGWLFMRMGSVLSFFDLFLVNADLFVQIAQISLPFFLFLQYGFSVPDQQGHTLLHGAVALIPQVGIMPDVPEQHSGIFETLQEFDPFDVVLAVVRLPAGSRFTRSRPFFS